MKNKTNNKVTIFGAGISGLVASICLAKSDFNVEVRDKREQVLYAFFAPPAIREG